MDILEIFYINKFHPPYNTANKYSDFLPSLLIEEKKWKQLERELIYFKPIVEEKEYKQPLTKEEIKERQKAGIERAKAAGKYKGRKRKAIDEEKFSELCAQWMAGERTATSIQREMNMPHSTFYKKAEERGYTKNKNKI